ncbi:ankyrin repeat domain-containing protein [Streptosporangiaceae bacterium NEAU-GS5]|nr:ankyrin repeat domain-containing protein [Streptosporangiaceae bacterium NEAU-GS5]
MTPAHRAVENKDLPRLRRLLDDGVDVEEVDGGLTLLQHAIDVELDEHIQTGEPLHVDVTAYLLARGADPLASPGGGAPPAGAASPAGGGSSCGGGSPGGGGTASALHMARVGGHWLAVSLMESWAERGR